MATQPLPDRDDESLPELTQLDADAAPVDSDLIGELRERSTREYQTAQSAASTHPTSRAAPYSQGNRTMLSTSKLVVSLTAAVVTAIAAFIGGLENGPDTERPPLTFADVLKKTADADTLQLAVVHGEQKAEVFVRPSGQVRWNDSGTQYRIASGSRLWEVNEQTNTARSGASPWFLDEQTPVDLLALLGVAQLTPEASARFRGAKVAGAATYNGRQCQLYRMTVGRDRPLVIEALADAKTNDLYTIAAWPEGPREDRPPLAELRLLARNVSVDESVFVVGKSLSDDGRIGKVVDTQGMVSLRPALARRWTPVSRQLIVKTGDRIRTDNRGANGVKVTLTSQVQITLGPGSLLQVESPFSAKLLSGELQIVLPTELDRDAFALTAPDDTVRQLKPDTDASSRTFLRTSRDGHLVAHDETPVWLKGFEGTTNDESLGSLIAKVDGRDVPLTVGYHHVKVEIRDQIARTTIEESFVNHTKTRLEGVFHFPLPQDASISGFGMWINGELIEADVVEKQRAREIYETILREKRDPGLLEWAGGNIFKARVFPIEPRSEKRIKIVYTQVLPLRGNQYRYSYGLRSELLRTTPVRDLSIDLFVNSELPLKSVRCGTHPVVTEQTENSAHVAFEAQEYSPERDFEVVCSIDAQQTDVVMVPHQRGDDGYFLIQLTPPGGEGNFQREVIPDGEPIKLLLVCDTSASMDQQSREKQASFVMSMLRSLGPDDRFNLAVSDVETQWLFDESTQATDQTIAQVRKHLDERISLGWTDLDNAFASIEDVAEDGCHIVYVGDGIVTARDPDPQAFVTRLGLLFGDEAPGTFHAVSVSSSFESVVLKAIAAVSRGSVRSISGERTPQEIALELLNEMAQPGLTDLNVQFRGLQVAAVYPEKLPNVAAGTQQILIGRYLPQGEDQSGQIVVTGTRGGEDVKYVARVSLKDAEKGNSFIPRLWARAHLDQLLQQGSSQRVKDEIIAMSEEFHIITPYTSLLVLETDADRERFGVKRRFLMRDGERFFADGRDNADYELLQQQMRKAGEWRIGLRRQVLRQLAELGRSREAIQQLMQWDQNGNSPYVRYSGRTGVHAASGGMYALDVSGPMPAAQPMWFSKAGESMPGTEALTASLQPVGGRLGRDGELPYAFESDAALPMDGQDFAKFDEDAEFADEAEFRDLNLMALGSKREQANKPLSISGVFSQPARFSRGRLSRLDGILPASRPVGGGGYGGGGGFGGNAWYGRNPEYTAWVNQLFPSLAAPAEAPETVESEWPEDAIAISQSLLRTNALRSLKGGLEIHISRESRDVRWERVTSRTSNLELYSPDRWLKRPTHQGTHTIVNWNNARERGVFSLMYHLGRIRDSVEYDQDSVVIGFSDYSQRPLHEQWRGYDIAVEELADGRVQLVMSHKDSASVQTRITIDTERNVILTHTSYSQDKLSSTITYSDFVQVGGTWWAGKATTTDAQNREIAVASQTVQLLDADKFDDRFQAETAARKQVQFVRLPFVTIPEAETAEKDGSASFAHRLALLLRACGIQKWDEAVTQLGELEKLAVDGSGARFIRSAVLQSARRNEDVRQFVLTESERLAAGPSQDDFQLAQTMLGYANSIVDGNEYLQLIDRLKPLYDRQPEHLYAQRAWKQHRVSALQSLGRTEEYLAIRRDLAETGEWDLQAQIQYARLLNSVGDSDAAYAWIDREIQIEVERSPYEFDQLFSTYYDLLNQAGRYQDLVTITERWMKASPTSSDPYKRHLGALVYADRSASADARCLEWLTGNRDEGELSVAAQQQVNAAVGYATGNVYGASYHVIDPKWLKPLAETARFFVRHEHRFDIAQSIIGNYRFSDSHESDLLRKWLFEILIEEASTLPQQQLHALVSWCRGAILGAETEGWRTIADALRERWDAAEDFKIRQPLGVTLLDVYSHRFDAEVLLFMRLRIDRAPDDNKAQLRTYLFNALVQRDWLDENEAEAFSLLPKLSSDEDEQVRLGTVIEALHRLVDSMLTNRQKVAKTAFQDQEHPEELTRFELAAKYREFLTAAREGIAARLKTASEELRNSDDTDLADWLQIERMTLDVRLNRNFEQVAGECWQWLGDEPPNISGDDRDADDSLFGAALRRRALAVVSNLAARRSATVDARQMLLDYAQAGIGRNDENSAAWKSIKYYLLIAFDDATSLERHLRNWIRTDEYPTPRRKGLAHILAEQGKIEQSIELYETIERDSQLAPADYAVLSGWYLVVDRREMYVRSKVESFKVWPEYQINNWLYHQLQPWQRTDQELPSELDENILFAFQALFEKSNSPRQYMYQLRQFYQACRDFRLLQMLADSVVGRTPQQVYEFLRSTRTTVLEEVRDEAVADEILARITELRETLRQPGRDVTPLDLRALDLLEAMVERKASDVLNEPGPHVEKALAALKRAFEHDWADGEARQMAKLLSDLSRIKQQELADEQIRQLTALHGMTEPGTDDRLWTGWFLGYCEFWGYGRRDVGLAHVENAVREYEQSHPDGWPAHTNEVFSGYISMLTGVDRYAAAENVINRQLANPLNEAQVYWLTQRMDDVHIGALSNRGQTSLGSGEVLYRNILKRLLKATETDNHQHRYETTQKILTLFDTAKRRFLDYREDLMTYAFEQLPKILERQTSNYQSIVDRTANRLDDLIDVRTALRFLITQIENYPLRLMRSWQNPWQQFGYRVAQWREHVGGNLGDLEPRLLKLVQDHLRRDLRTRNQRSRYLYDNRYSYFWKEKADEFAKVAEEVYDEVSHSRRFVQYIATYLYDGLDRYGRAIEMMLVAHGQGLLTESGQAVVCRWLDEQKRYGEAIPILEPLVELQPDRMEYRCLLITAYHHTRRHEQRDEMLAATNEHFRAGGRWVEANVSQLANCMRILRLYELAVEYYGEVIPLHQRTAPNRGIGNGTLSTYYQRLAEAHSGLGQTKEAVDAAASAIISWGPKIENRKTATDRLREVLQRARDLDDYVAYLDEQLEQTGQASPIVRRMIGRVYVDKIEPAKAIPQLKLALELRPGDTDAYQDLIKAYDAAGDADGAVGAVLAQLDVDRHNLALYQNLAKRLAEDEGLSERAATTIVEAAPNEAEHHAALATLRGTQKRWGDAIMHWKHAARLRALEPTNLVKLAEAQISGGETEAASRTIDSINNRRWPSRFDDQLRQDRERLSRLLKAAM